MPGLAPSTWRSAASANREGAGVPTRHLLPTVSAPSAPRGDGEERPQDPTSHGVASGNQPGGGGPTPRSTSLRAAQEPGGDSQRGSTAAKRKQALSPGPHARRPRRDRFPAGPDDDAGVPS